MPIPDEYVEIHQRRYHGHITETSFYDTDFFEDNEELRQIRYNNFIKYHKIKLIFADIVNGTFSGCFIVPHQRIKASICRIIKEIWKKAKDS